MATILTAPTDQQAIGDSYRRAIEVLDAELRQLDGVFRGLKDDEWAMSTKLVPLDPTQKHWTVFELAGPLRHLDRPGAHVDGRPSGWSAWPRPGQLLHLPPVGGGPRRL